MTETSVGRVGVLGATGQSEVRRAGPTRHRRSPHDRGEDTDDQANEDAEREHQEAALPATEAPGAGEPLTV